MGWLESSCPFVAETYAPRTADLRAANCGVLFLSFFLNSATAGWSQGVEKQPPPPTPPQRRCSKEAEEKVGGVNGRDLCMTRRHGAVYYPREATNEQSNTEKLYIKTLGEEWGRAAQSDVDTEAPGGWLDFHSLRPDKNSPHKTRSEHPPAFKRVKKVHFIPPV